jgi:hypothetical protein
MASAPRKPMAIRSLVLIAPPSQETTCLVNDRTMNGDGFEIHANHGVPGHFVSRLGVMKLPLASGVLSATNAPGSGTFRTGGQYVFRVDRRFDHVRQPLLATQELREEHYIDAAPADRWDVAIDGARVLILPRGADAEAAIEGRELVHSGFERRFDLGRAGHFFVRGDEAELTFYSDRLGVPVAWSERGTLVSAARTVSL